MRKMKTGVVLICIGFSILFFSSGAFAINNWYYGKVTHLQTMGSDGSFIVYTDNQTILNVCQYKRVNFRVSDMGQERTKLAFLMALAAYTAGRRWGVVINLPEEIPDGYEQGCYASSTASQGAGIMN
ncbi:MAG: hypothetical protein D3922_07780 [Candidatus Electrothrix sp. AR1]|nr:hypothetical protein [Candidatus Electrothrix sp. AR1]